MELYLVKDVVKIVPIGEAFSKSKKHNVLIKDLEIEQEGGTSWNGPEALEQLKRQHGGPSRPLLTLSGLPVTLSSISSDVSSHFDQFAKRVAMKLAKTDYLDPENSKWEKMKLELIICDNPNSLDGYFLLSSEYDVSKIDVVERLGVVPDSANLMFSFQVALGYLPTDKADAAAPESLVSMRMTSEDFGTYYLEYGDHVGNNIPVPVPRKIMAWSKKRGTTAGFIYSKTSVKVILNERAVDIVYGYSDEYKSFLADQHFTDLEIVCENGEIVKCHRTFLADKKRAGSNNLFGRKFKEMMKEGGGQQQAGPWKLEMQRCKKCVEALITYIYCGNVSAGMENCDEALELLKVAVEYKVIGLKNAMDEIIMAKGSTDFEYFSVEGALNLFLLARKRTRLRGLRDKAVRVLQNYLKTKSEKIMTSKEYQDLFKNQPQVAMELSKLYTQRTQE